jgi:hypothetical protein
MTIRASSSGIDPKETLGILKKLQPFGFGDTEFSLLHQWGSKGSLTRFRNYCREKQWFRVDDSNHRLHQRLAFVLSRCEGGALHKGKTFASLATEAFQQFPKVR